jgi:hypothetical protein
LHAIVDGEFRENLFSASFTNCFANRFNEFEELRAFLTHEGLAKEFAEFANISAQRLVIAGD